MVFPDGSCELKKNLGCVNFLKFTVEDDSGFRTQCIKVNHKLEDLCGVAQLADGRELFRLSADSTVKIKVEGLRVFPATSCEVTTACLPKSILVGETEFVRIGDLAGAALELPIHLGSQVCAGNEVFFNPGNRTCDSFCSGMGASVVCDGVQGGCLCQMEDR